MSSEGLAKLVPPVRAARLIQRAKVAAKAYSEQRYGDARSILGPIVKEAPDWISAQELMGLSLYRLGMYRSAATSLERVASARNSVEHHAIIADCYRAQRKWSKVEEFWTELGAASPSAELVAEGLVVYAGSLADRGRLQDAIRVLESSWYLPKRPKPRHFQVAYVLADLYERQGMFPRSRRLFGWIAGHDSDFFDVVERSKRSL